MPWTSTFRLAVLLMLFLVPNALAHGVKTRTLAIAHPWTKPTQEAGADVIVRMTITNRSRYMERLLSASTEAAGDVEVCPLVLVSDRPCDTASGLQIRGGGRLELAPDGPHLRIRGLTRPLAPYEMFVVSLNFERAGRIDVEVMVED